VPCLVVARVCLGVHTAAARGGRSRRARTATGRGFRGAVAERAAARGPSRPRLAPTLSRGSRRFTPPKGGPRCARRAEVARLGTGRVMGGYVARGCCSREAALDSLRSRTGLGA
jgi:hypothetical protein